MASIESLSITLRLTVEGEDVARWRVRSLVRLAGWLRVPLRIETYAPGYGWQYHRPRSGSGEATE